MKVIFIGNIKSIHLQRWVDYFQSKSYQVKVVSTVRTSYKNVEIIGGRQLFRNNPIVFYLSRIPFVGFIPRIIAIRKFLAKEKPNILHIHNIGGTYFSTDFALAGYKPLVISVWGSDVVAIVDKPSLRRIKRKWALGKATVITATSEFLAKKTMQFVPNKKIEVIPFGIDLNVFNPEKVKTTKKKGEIVIGFVKHLEKSYGADTLIKAFSLAEKKTPNSSLWLVGGGTQEGDLRALVKRLNLQKKIKFVGAVPNNEVPNYLASFDIFVMPSMVEEAFGVSALEAEAMEVPVVASNTGGVPEVVKDGETGLLVESKNPKALADAVTKLIGNGGLRKEMGKKGREFVLKNYDLNKNAEKMNELYSKLAKL